MDLRTYLFKERKSIVDFAKEVGTSYSYMRSIVAGVLTPSKGLEVRIRDRTGNKVKRWKRPKKGEKK